MLKIDEHWEKRKADKEKALNKDVKVYTGALAGMYIPKEKTITNRTWKRQPLILCEWCNHSFNPDQLETHSLWCKKKPPCAICKETFGHQYKCSRCLDRVCNKCSDVIKGMKVCAKCL